MTAATSSGLRSARMASTTCVTSSGVAGATGGCFSCAPFTFGGSCLRWLGAPFSPPTLPHAAKMFSSAFMPSLNALSPVGSSSPGRRRLVSATTWADCMAIFVMVPIAWVMESSISLAPPDSSLAFSMVRSILSSMAWTVGSMAGLAVIFSIIRRCSPASAA